MTLERRLRRLEEQAGADSPAAPLRVVQRAYNHDGTPRDPSPVPECDVLIRRQFVKGNGRGGIAPGYVPIGERGRRLAGLESAKRGLR